MSSERPGDRSVSTASRALLTSRSVISLTLAAVLTLVAVLALAATWTLRVQERLATWAGVYRWSGQGQVLPRGGTQERRSWSAAGLGASRVSWSVLGRPGRLLTNDSWAGNDATFYLW